MKGFKIGNKVRINRNKLLPERNCRQAEIDNHNQIGFVTGFWDNKYIQVKINNYSLCYYPEALELIDDFILPEAWYVVVNKDNQLILSKWRFNQSSNYLVGIGNICGITIGMIKGKNHNPRNIIKDNGFNFGIEITTEQFIKYVLKENIEEDKKLSTKVYTLKELKDKLELNKYDSEDIKDIIECLSS